MARTRVTDRKSTGGKAPRVMLAGLPYRRPACYKTTHSNIKKWSTFSAPISQPGYSFLKKKANFKGAKDFPHFVKLPCEIQNRVWEMLAEEPRVVSVSTKTKIERRLRSSIPPILHVCSASRAVGLKHYTLAFESQQVYHRWTDDPEYKTDPPPVGVYFNFERDTLYLRENWNENGEGAWSCLSHFTNLMNRSDLKRVRRVGLDVDARVCSLKTSSQSCHPPNFASWDALEILYIGYEDVRLGSDCPISFGRLESKDYKGFIQRYKMNPSWSIAMWLPRGFAKAVEYLRNTVPIVYDRHRAMPAGSFRKVELVSIRHL